MPDLAPFSHNTSVMDDR